MQLPQFLIQPVSGAVRLANMVSTRISVFPAELVGHSQSSFFTLNDLARRDWDCEVEAGRGAVAGFHDVKAHLHIGELPDQVKSCTVVAGQVPAA